MLKGLKSLITGVVAGTAIGVLLSPKKGSEIRKDLLKEIEAGGMGVNTMKKILKEIGEDIEDLSKDGFQELKETDAYKKAEKKVMAEVKKAKKTVKKKVSSAKKEVKKTVKTVKKATKKK